MDQQQIDALHSIHFDWGSQASIPGRRVELLTKNDNKSGTIQDYTPPPAKSRPLLIPIATMPIRRTSYAHELDEIIDGVASGDLGMSEILRRLKAMREMG